MIRTVGNGESLLDSAVTSAVLDRLSRGKHMLKDEKLARLSPQPRTSRREGTGWLSSVRRSCPKMKSTEESRARRNR